MSAAASKALLRGRTALQSHICPHLRFASCPPVSVQSHLEHARFDLQVCCRCVMYFSDPFRSARSPVLFFFLNTTEYTHWLFSFLFFFFLLFHNNTRQKADLELVSIWAESCLVTFCMISTQFCPVHSVAADCWYSDPSFNNQCFYSQEDEWKSP